MSLDLWWITWLHANIFSKDPKRPIWWLEPSLQAHMIIGRTAYPSRDSGKRSLWSSLICLFTGNNYLSCFFPTICLDILYFVWTQLEISRLASQALLVSGGTKTVAQLKRSWFLWNEESWSEEGNFASLERRFLNQGIRNYACCRCPLERLLYC